MSKRYVTILQIFAVRLLIRSNKTNMAAGIFVRIGEISVPVPSGLALDAKGMALLRRLSETPGDTLEGRILRERIMREGGLVLNKQTNIWEVPVARVAA